MQLSKYKNKMITDCIKKWKKSNFHHFYFIFLMVIKKKKHFIFTVYDNFEILCIWKIAQWCP